MPWHWFLRVQRGSDYLWARYGRGWPVVVELGPVALFGYIIGGASGALLPFFYLAAIFLFGILREEDNRRKNLWTGAWIAASLLCLVFAVRQLAPPVQVEAMVNSHESRIDDHDERIDSHEGEFAEMRAEIERLKKASKIQVGANRDAWDKDFPLGWGVVYLNGMEPIYKDQSTASEIGIDWSAFKANGVLANGKLVFDPPAITMPGIGVNLIRNVHIDSKVGSQQPIGFQYNDILPMSRIVLSDDGHIGVLLWLDRVPRL